MTLEYRCSNCGTLLQTTNAAPLIAAAPDMLAALQAAVKLADENLPRFRERTGACKANYDMCVAAIAKATEPRA